MSVLVELDHQWRHHVDEQAKDGQKVRLQAVYRIQQSIIGWTCCFLVAIGPSVTGLMVSLPVFLHSSKALLGTIMV
jgi:hypothetical protein